MKTCKKLLSSVLCLSLVIGTLAIGISGISSCFGITAFAEDSAEPAEGNPPVAAEENSGSADSIAETIESVVLPEDFKPGGFFTYGYGVDFGLAYEDGMFNSDHYYSMMEFPEYIRINFKDGKTIDVQNANNENPDLFGDFVLPGDDKAHTVKTIYDFDYVNNEPCKFKVLIDDVSVFEEDPAFLANFLPFDLFIFNICLFAELINSMTCLVSGAPAATIFNNLKENIKRYFDSFSAYMKYNIKNVYLDSTPFLPLMTILEIEQRIKERFAQ